MKHLTFRQLRIFEAVAVHLSFSRAAQVLFLTQPAVSMQVKQIQEHVGMPLFLQVGKRIELTEPGRLLLVHARKIMAQMHDAELAMANLKAGADRPIRVGVVTSGSYFFPRLMGAFTQEHPGVRFDLTIQPRDELLRRLGDGRIDLALVVQAPKDARLLATPLGEHPFVIVAPPDHPLAGQPCLPLNRLAGDRIITRETGTDTRSVTDEALMTHVESSRLLEIPSTEAIKQSVMAGMGVSLLSAHAVQAECQAGQLCVLDVEGFPVQRAWHLVHRQDAPLPPMSQAFRTFLVDLGDQALDPLPFGVPSGVGTDRAELAMAA